MSQETKNDAVIRVAIRQLQLRRQDLKIAMFKIPAEIANIDNEIARLQRLSTAENNVNNELTNEEE